METRIYQICYSNETLANIPHGFLILDNSKNERPDWREYWAIRNFITNNYLSDNVLYGFLSPKFEAKTNLDHEKIQDFLKINYNDESIVTFSPFWDLMAIFKNVFEQGDFFHGGLSDVCQKLADNYLGGVNLKDSITNSKNTIFCNYFLAKRNFWLEWIALGEIIFKISEKNESELAAQLNAPTTYGEQQLPMKIFVQERLATICLLCNTHFKSLNYSPFSIGASSTPFNKFYSEAIVSDALKCSYMQTGSIIYLNEFSKIRDSIIMKLQGNI